MAALALLAAAWTGWRWLGGAFEIPGGWSEGEWRWPSWDQLTVMRAYPRPGAAQRIEGTVRTRTLPLLPGCTLRHEVIATSDMLGTRTIVYVHTRLERR